MAKMNTGGGGGGYVMLNSPKQQDHGNFIHKSSSGTVITH